MLSVRVDSLEFLVDDLLSRNELCLGHRLTMNYSVVVARWEGIVSVSVCIECFALDSGLCGQGLLARSLGVVSLSFNSHVHWLLRCLWLLKMSFPRLWGLILNPILLVTLANNWRPTCLWKWSIGLILVSLHGLLEHGPDCNLVMAHSSLRPISQLVLLDLSISIWFCLFWKVFCLNVLFSMRLYWHVVWAMLSKYVLCCFPLLRNVTLSRF